MRRGALYSRSNRIVPPKAASAAPTPPPPKPPSRLKQFATRFEKPLWLASGLMCAALALGGYNLLNPPPRELTQKDIDGAVLHTLKNLPPDPSRASMAYGVIAPSIVLVRRLGQDAEEKDEKGKEKGKAEPRKRAQSKDKESAEAKDAAPKKIPEEGAPNESKSAEITAPDPNADPKAQIEKQKGADKDGKYKLQGIGTGVVFSEAGLIFTCLHVIAGAEGISVTFADGTESEVDIVNVQPENDLAVLKPKVLPDDLVPATLRSTKGLNVGDEVIAVGFPFGIGPTTTSGVVSGLRREHYSQEGKRNLIDLIQFDAAANPGNSGGPLVTAEGDVVGIVTSIMNPINEGFFVGIAFAVPIENAASGAGMSPF